LSDAFDRGITVTEIAARGEPVDATPETTAAFIGRALRGPLNTPVLVRNLGEFRRGFGDVWSRSSLGPAVRQFFEHGGKNLYIVRVANQARGAMICLPASGSALVLRALEPGSTERVRAAVDYDGIDDADEALFNLTLQRIDPGNGLIIDQELYRGLSYLETSETFVGDALLSSMMVRIEHPYPSHRPEATIPSHARPGSEYVEHVEDGTDGTELTDYDLVGSQSEGRGLFALEQVEHVDILYLPPPGKGIDVGPTALLAAERFCRSRGAMLVVDPDAGWSTAGEAVNGIRQRGYASPNMVSYFPRLVSRTDRDAHARVVGGALAGLMCKLDRGYGAWKTLDQQGLGFRRDLGPAITLDEGDISVLAREGINAIARGPAGKSRVRGSVTMVRGSDPERLLSSLPVRRLCLRIINSIEQATRWAVFEPFDERLEASVRAQVHAYLVALADLGAFESDRVEVQCDAGLWKKPDAVNHGISILVAFQPRGCSTPIFFTLHQSAEGYRVASTAFAPTIDDCA
jgi:phage tail sheath protein FI